MRFPEFTDEWRSKKLGDLSDVTKLAGFEFTKYVNYSDNGNIIALRGVNIKKNKLDLTDVKYIDNSDFNKLNRSKLYPGDLLFTYVGTIGNVALIFKKNKYYLAPNVCRIRSESFINSQFLKFYFNTQLIKKEINRYVTKSSQPALSMENIRKFNVNNPKIKEQNKIANFISLIDRKIYLLEKKLVLWDKHLNYWINNLTTKNDKYNFHWKIFKFKDFLEEYNEKSKINNQYPLLSSTKDEIVLQENYFNKRIASKDNKGYKILHLNQLVLSPQNLWLGNININDEFEIGIVSPSYKIYNINKNIINQSYLKFIIKKPKMLYLYETVSEQGASVVRRNLNTNLFMNLKIKLPSINEQKIIGDFLLHLYNKNQLIKNKINILKIFKKGLLQKMFV